MRITYKIIIGVIAALLVIVGAAALNGLFSAPRDTHPPYDQLPTVVEANEALDKHQDLAKEIEALGDGIRVKVGKPFPEHQDRGLIMVSYSSRSERDAIADLLKQSEGFGVPVHLEKR
ncbi:hypothetical protein PRVXH_002165 [Proteinivorax hydrogeniformans]|uniref:Sporulation related protein n=1 Tax=Proteinivorax hydrogeniformans TaxID=1826727 RepID=A0AAU8HSA5_9FIRM